MVKYLIETMGVPGHGLFEIEKVDMSKDALKRFCTPFTGLLSLNMEEKICLNS